MIEYNGAEDEIFTLIDDTVKLTEVSTLIGATPLIFWPDLINTKPEADNYFIEVYKEDLISRQSGFRNGINRRFTNTGIVGCMINYPKSDTKAAYRGKRLAVILRNAFRSHQGSGNVTLRNSRMNRVKPTDTHYKFKVVAEYDYDDLG